MHLLVRLNDDVIREIQVAFSLAYQKQEELLPANWEMEHILEPSRAKLIYYGEPYHK